MPICQACHRQATARRRAAARATDPKGYAARLRDLARRWRERNPDKVLAILDRYRARIRSNPYIEAVYLDVLYVRDKGICQICLERCPRTEASRDHIIPVTRGGPTSYSNMVLAHKRCNSRKGNRTVTQQMRLF